MGSKMTNKEHPLSICESQEHLGEDQEDLKGFVKKFAPLDPDKAKELRKNLEERDMMKMTEYHISKIIDILPVEKEEVNKIFTDTTLDEDETNKVIETVKQFK